MTADVGCRGTPLSYLDETLADDDRTLLVGAPGIGLSSELDRYDDERFDVVRSFDGIVSASPERHLVVDDFYDLFSRYETAKPDERESIREAFERQLSGGTVFVRTTPYRLRWLLTHRPDGFERLLGDLSQWTVRPVCADVDDARDYLRRCDSATDVSTDHIEETRWTYQFDARFADCIPADEDIEELFTEIRYATLVPGMLAGDGTAEERLQASHSARDSLREMFRDVAPTGTLDPSGTMGAVQGFFDTVREFTDGLRAEGALDTLRDAVPSVLADVPDEYAALAAGTTVSGPVFAVACLGYWAFATRKQHEQRRNVVRDEFRRLLDSEIQTLPAVEREDFEEEWDLEPGTLLHLSRAASGDVWARLEDTVDSLEHTVERVDDLERTVERHEAVIAELEKRLRRSASGLTTYQTLQEFEREHYELLEEVPPYEPPNYSEASSRDRNAVGHSDDLTATERLLELTDDETTSVILITGESGIGKSRLLVEAGRKLHDRTDVDVWYQPRPTTAIEPPTADRTVLFLDEVGSTDEFDPRFFDVAASTRREFDQSVTVVAAVRPVYRQEVERQIPDHATTHTLTLEPLTSADDGEDETGSVEAFLSDIDVSEETVQEIYDATEGNPFLARLIALAERGSADSDRSLGSHVEELIERQVLPEATDVSDDQRAGTIRDLLRAVAALGDYDVDRDHEAVSSVLGLDADDRELLIDLSKNRYVTRQSGDGSRYATATYTPRVDVFAEYVRWRWLDDPRPDREHERPPSTYRTFVSECLDTDPVGVVRGLVELRKSSLERFDFFDADAVAEWTDALLTGDGDIDGVATELVDSDAALADVLRTAVLLALVSPIYEIPHDDLLERCNREDTTTDSATPLFNLLTVTYRRADEIADAESTRTDDSLPVSAADVFEWGASWLDVLDELAEDSDDSKLRLRLAKGLVNAANYEGGDGQFERMRQRIDRLETLADESDDPEVRLRLAKGLYNAAKAEGRDGQFERMRQRINRLETLADESDDHEVRLRLAKVGHLTALGHYAENEAYDSAADLLDDIERLSDTLGGFWTGKHWDTIESVTLSVCLDAIRDGRLDLLGRVADTLRDSLSEGRWQSLSTTVLLAVDDLHQEGEISFDTYERVVDDFDDE